MRTVNLAILMALSCGWLNVAAQDKKGSEWVGKQVMTIRDADFKLPGETVTKSDVCEVMTINLQKGSWLWVNKKGRVDSQEGCYRNIRCHRLLHCPGKERTIR